MDGLHFTQFNSADELQQVPIGSVLFLFFLFFLPVLQSRAVFRHQTVGWDRRSLADFTSSHRAVSLASVKVLIPVCA